MRVKARKIIYIAICAAFCIAIGFVTFQQSSIKKSEKSMLPEIEIDSYYDETVCKEKIYERKHLIPYDIVEKIYFYVCENSNSKIPNDIYLEIVDPNEDSVFFSHIIYSDAIIYGGWNSINIGDSIKFSADEDYLLRIWSSAETEDNAVRIAVDYVSGQKEAILIFVNKEGVQIPSIATAIMLVSFIALLLLLSYNIRFTKDFSTFSEPIVLDYVVFTIVFVFSSLFFGHTYDLPITARHAYDLIDFSCNGDFFNYYSCVLQKAESGGYYGQGMTDGANYNILNYILLAIPLLPVYIINKIVTINNVYNVCFIVSEIQIMAFVLWSAKLLATLCIKIGESKKNSKVIAYYYLTSPMLIFVTSEIGQVDIIYIMITLVALRFYVEKKFFKFSLMISLACAFKPFVLIMYAPLILYVEKDILKLIKHVAISLSISILTRLLFVFDSGYSITKEHMNSHYGFLDKLLESGIKTGDSFNSFFLVSICLVCLFFYIKKYDNFISVEKSAVYIPLITMTIFTLFVKWHPQWISMLIPFLMIALFVNKKDEIIFFMELVFTVTFIGSVNMNFAGLIDTCMVNGGVLPMIFGLNYNGPGFNELVDQVGVLSSQSFSVIINSIMNVSLVSIAAMIIKRGANKSEICKEDIVLKREYVLFRLSVLLVLNMFYLALFFNHTGVSVTTNNLRLH